MRLTTHYHHTRYEENGSEGKFSLRMPRRKSSVFKPPVLIQFQVTADTRQLTDPFDGFLLGKRYLIHDRDTKFTQAFDALLKDSGVEPILLPPRSPDLNAHCERFVRSIKEEALSQMVILGERALYYTIHQYLAHYHTERNHQGLDNQLIAQEGEVGCQMGPVVRRERLGGLLSYYHRAAA